jgi:uncharacterized protein (TIGR02300 family)
VVKPELGTKRTCPNCATRFYDLLKDPITCPKCSTSFVAMSILPSKTEIPGAVPQGAPPKPRVVEEREDDQDVELVSLEDAEEPDKGDDDETAGIEDVDLGEDSSDTNEEEDDTFLVEEEEEGGSLSDLVEGGSGGKEDEEEN